MRRAPAGRRTAPPSDEAIVEGDLVLEIEDATREQIADTLATLFLAVLEREAAQETGRDRRVFIPLRVFDDRLPGVSEAAE